MTTRFQLRRDTAELWKANNVKLEEGEMGIEWNTQPGQGEEVITKIKIGDGINKWNDLPYITDVLDKDVSELDKSVETLSDDLNARISALSTSLTNLSNNVVHKTGNETINGAKTFTSIPYITKSGDTRLICKGTDVVQGTAPSANKYSGFRYLDNNNVELGTVFTRYHTNGELQTKLWVKTPKAGATTTAEMGINAKTDGSFYTYCPKPTDDTTTSTQIDTVGARNTKLGGLTIKQMTLAEYNALATKDANTLYNITDDNDVTMDLLKTIYPVGSIYLTTSNTCPLGSLFGTWSLVSNGRALWGGNGSNGGSTIEAGLPNITGRLSGLSTDTTESKEGLQGAFYFDTTNKHSGAGSGSGDYYAYFDASRSNPIYGNSDTVQPPAYVINVFRRTA